LPGRVALGEGRVGADHRRPGPDPGVLRERLLALASQRDHAAEPALADEREVLREARVLGDAVAGPARRRVEDEALDALGTSDRERDGARAPDAAAHDVGALDPEVVEQAARLRRVVGPPDLLDPAPRPARLAPVERDAREALGEALDEAESLVDAERAPILDRRVEAAGREQQERRPRARHLVAGRDPV